MKKNFWKDRKKVWTTAGCLLLAAVVAGTGLFTYQTTHSGDIPELVTFIDPEGVTAQEDEVPLASGTKTTRKVTTKKTTKKTKMKKKAKKTATTTKKKTKKTTKTKSSKTQKVKTNTKVATTIKTSTKKNSKIKTIKTTTVTTVTTTTTATKYYKTASSAQTAAKTTSAGTQTYKIRSVAGRADARVLNAYEKMGFVVEVKPTVAYSGCFDAAKQTITLKQMNSTVYHELGHFVEFVGGTSSVKQAISNAYSKEKSKYTAYNKSYVLQNSSEYFAESFKNYCENPSALKSSRPLTYSAIQQALNNITDTRVNTIMKVYSAVWK